MADNFLERQQEEYQRLKSSGGEAQRLRWRKQLKAYQERLKDKGENSQSNNQ